MKKIIFILCFIPFLGLCQEKIDSYHNSAANKDYNISVSQPNKKGIFTYWIECKSLDSRSTQSVLIIDSDKIQDFITYINYLRDIHKKWSETAKANNVTEISKEIQYKSKMYQAAFSYGDWNFDNSVSLQAAFKILMDKYYTIVNSGELKSVTNQFIKSDGFMFSFNEDSDFDDLLEKLNNDESMKFLAEKKSKEDLFKN